MQQTKLTPADISSAPETKDPITGKAVLRPITPKDVTAEADRNYDLGRKHAKEESKARMAEHYIKHYRYRSNPQPLAPKDWALKLLRGSSVTNWRDEIEYARWVRSVACAGAMGIEAHLVELEREMQELASGYVRRANEKAQ